MTDSRTDPRTDSNHDAANPNVVAADATTMCSGTPPDSGRDGALVSSPATPPVPSPGDDTATAEPAAPEAPADPGDLDDAEAEDPDEGATALTVDQLVEEVHAGLARSRNWREVSKDVVRDVVATLDLSPEPSTHATPRLRVRRLRFTGEKSLAGRAGETPAQSPIAYDQEFHPGVNVLLVPDNSVGKSSIFKTIKFALTGDDSDYDADVRSWIRAVWLHFTLGEARHTIHLERSDTGLTGYLAAGFVEVSMADLDASDAVTLWRVRDAMSVREGLQTFFLDRFALRQLGWTQSIAGEAAAERRVSWLTYFQALVVPHGSEQYLLVDDEHSMGNQDGLLLSVLLGLHLTQPINALLIETQKTKSAGKVSDEQRKQAETEMTALEAERAKLADELARLTATQDARRGAVEANPDAQRLRELHFRHGERLVERLQLKSRRDELTTSAQRDRARARSLRESAELRRHFTGLAVEICPNCDADVEVAAVERERHEHHCRLCGKEAPPASAEDVAELFAQADALDAEAARTTALREEVSAQLRERDAELTRLEQEAERVQAALQQGPTYALPTREEQERRDALVGEMGALRARITMAAAIAGRSTAGSSDAEARAEIQQRVRQALQGHAERLNAAVLRRLNRLTRDMVARTGAGSITDVTCSAVGKLSLQKNGVKVGFSRLNSPGERLRVKLAFFLAMMRLGRIKGAGRHPGFLMIDQPGSDEIVEADFDALARVLRDVETNFAGEVQVICFTARQRFAAATTDAKVYGAQAGDYVF